MNETTASLEAATTKVTELTTQNTDLTDKLTKMTAHADEDDQMLEKWRNLPPPEQIKGIISERDGLKTTVAALKSENKLISASRDDFKAKYFALVGDDAAVPLPTGLKGEVMAVDPKYGFVVLNIGDEQGVKERGEMMINRKGRLIGKVKITSVQKDTSVASIIPAWKHGQVMEGDQVLY